MSARRMLPQELEAAIGVWRAANIARSAQHGAERIARIREKLAAADALAFVALRSEIVGMALAEPGRLDDGEGELDPTFLHISMVFVHPAEQGTGVGSSLVRHVLDVARSLDYPAGGCLDLQRQRPRPQALRRRWDGGYGKSARMLPRTQIQYGCELA